MRPLLQLDLHAQMRPPTTQFGMHPIVTEAGSITKLTMISLLLDTLSLGELIQEHGVNASKKRGALRKAHEKRGGAGLHDAANDGHDCQAAEEADDGSGQDESTCQGSPPRHQRRQEASEEASAQAAKGTDYADEVEAQKRLALRLHKQLPYLPTSVAERHAID